MILPERVLGRSPAQMMRFGRAIFEIRSRDVVADLLRDLVRALEVALQRDEGARSPGRCPRPGLPITAHSATLGCETTADSTSAVERQVAGDVDRVVDAPEDPEVAVLVLAGRVADE